jgi:1-acyl-sn-glycerol-3-phosphate acyltransferase
MKSANVTERGKPVTNALERHPVGRRTPSIAYRVAALLLRRPVFGLVYRLEATGIEHIPDSGFVLCANQVSNVDSFALASTLYPRPLRFMAKAELFNSVLGPLVRAVGGFPVDRDRRDLDAIANAVAIVRDGDGLVVFPEGTRRQKGFRKSRVARPHTGAAHIALTAGVPLVPAAIRGTDALLRLRRWSVAYGPGVPLDDLQTTTMRAARREATARLWARVLELEEELAQREAGAR